MQIMAIAILPVAVSVHTIVSFDFSMANVPMWHSTIFGPYFVAGAIFSGIAVLIAILSNPYTRTIVGCVIASCGVVVGMWLERFLIVVPSLGHKALPYSW